MAHHVTTGVGGVALTNDVDLALLMRSYANHGRSMAYLPGYTSAKLSKYLLSSRFRFDRIGYSCRGTEFEAVLGLSQLGGLEKNVKKRRQVAAWLREELYKYKDLVVPSEIYRHSWMMFPLLVRDVDKYDLCLHLERNGIETRDMMPITSQPCYRGLFQEGSYSVAEDINEHGFYIPCNPGMTEKDVKRISRIFSTFDKWKN
jgi:perosamine synthetase